METRHESCEERFSLWRACTLVLSVRLILIMLSVSATWLLPMYVSDADYQFNDERFLDDKVSKLEICALDNQSDCRLEKVMSFNEQLPERLMSRIKMNSCSIHGYPTYSMVNIDGDTRASAHLSASRVLRGQWQWDALQYAQIALNGYEDVKQVAFYPMYPMLLRMISGFIPDGIYSSSWGGEQFFMLKRCPRDKLALAALAINFLATLGSVFLLYFICEDFFPELTPHVFLVYSLSPANSFFVAAYTEQQFSFIFLAAVVTFYLHRKHGKQRYMWIHAGILVVGTLTRPNGMTLLAPCLYFFVLDLAKQFSHMNNELNLKATLLFILLVGLAHCGYTVFLAGIVCRDDAISHCASIQELVIETTNQPYLLHWGISNVSSFVPTLTYSGTLKLTMPQPNLSIYPAVQKQFWNVGFLEYWTYSQIPNFLLALPIFVCVSVLAQNLIYDCLVAAKKQTLLWTSALQIYSGDSKDRPTSYLPAALVPWVVHGLVSALLCMLYMNVQVSTRFLLVNPVFPLLLGFWLAEDISRGKHAVNSCILWWGVGYSIVGMQLFSLGLPWT